MKNFKELLKYKFIKIRYNKVTVSPEWFILSKGFKL